MEHKELDEWLELESRMSDTSKLVYSVIIDNNKTAIVKHEFSGSVWLYQSSINIDGFETGVDVIRLTSDMVNVIKNKC
jgi:hypothetical protein